MDNTYNTCKNLLESLTVQGDLSWNFFPNKFEAELDVSRILVRLEDKPELGEAVLKELEGLKQVALNLKKALGVEGNSNILFGLEWSSYEDAGKKNSKIAHPFQQTAWQHCVNITEILNDKKIFSFCN